MSSKPVYMSFSTSIVMAMSRLEVSSVLSSSRGASIRGTGTTPAIPRTSSARTSTWAFGFILGVDTALVGPAFSGSILRFLEVLSFPGSTLGLLGVLASGVSLGGRLTFFSLVSLFALGRISSSE